MIQDLYIVRHGETDFNRRHIVQGRGVNASLNETGRRQSRLFFEAYRHIPFQHVYISSLNRTRETAEPFIETGLPWSAHPELDEIDWGEREGLKATAVMRAEYARIIQGWTRGELNVSLPGGESPLDVQQRMQVFLNHWESQNQQASLIISHGRSMRVLLSLLLESPLEQMERFEHGNLALYHLQREGDKFSLLVRNSDRHLRFQSEHGNH